MNFTLPFFFTDMILIGVSAGGDSLEHALHVLKGMCDNYGQCRLQQNCFTLLAG